MRQRMRRATTISSLTIVPNPFGTPTCYINMRRGELPKLVMLSLNAAPKPLGVIRLYISLGSYAPYPDKRKVVSMDVRPMYKL